MQDRPVQSRRTLAGVLVLAAVIAGAIWALRSSPNNAPAPTSSQSAPSAPSAPPPSTTVPIAPDFPPASPPLALAHDPTRPDAEPSKVAQGACPPGLELFDDKTLSGRTRGCGRLDPATKKIRREGEWSIVEDTGNTLIGTYVDGRREGDWILWSSTGKALHRWQYKNDAYEGWEVEWNDSSQKIIERHYQGGILDGDVYYIGPDGTRVHEVWKAGRRIDLADPAPTYSASPSQ